MDVTFTRTHERRYRVTVSRTAGSTVVIDPAPGYDELLPHDLVHFVVEAACGIEYGIFGRFAAGGIAESWSPRRARRKSAWRTKRLRELGAGDVAKSERLAAEARTAWQAFTAGRPEGSTTPELAAAVAKLDEAAAVWRTLAVGESMTLEWPLPERRLTQRAGTQRRHAQRSPR